MLGTQSQFITWLCGSVPNKFVVDSTVVSHSSPPLPLQKGLVSLHKLICVQGEILSCPGHTSKTMGIWVLPTLLATQRRHHARVNSNYAIITFLWHKSAYAVLALLAWMSKHTCTRANLDLWTTNIAHDTIECFLENCIEAHIVVWIPLQATLLSPTVLSSLTRQTPPRQSHYLRSNSCIATSWY